MPHNQAKNASDNANRASVRDEMMLPRTARSARVAALKLDTTRNPEPPSTTISGTVDKIIPPKSPGMPEKAQITMEWQAAGNFLAQIEAPGFAADLLSRFTVHVTVKVTATGELRFSDGTVGGCSILIPKAKPDWPEVGNYSLTTGVAPESDWPRQIREPLSAPGSFRRPATPSYAIFRCEIFP